MKTKTFYLFLLIASIGTAFSQTTPVMQFKRKIVVPSHTNIILPGFWEMEDTSMLYKRYIRMLVKEALVDDSSVVFSKKETFYLYQNVVKVEADIMEATGEVLDLGTPKGRLEVRKRLAVISWLFTTPLSFDAPNSPIPKDSSRLIFLGYVRLMSGIIVSPIFLSDANFTMGWSIGALEPIGSRPLGFVRFFSRKKPDGRIRVE